LRDRRRRGYGQSVFERFTKRARQVVDFAQLEALELKHNYVGTEHILLGLLREEEGVAARALESLEITVEEARAKIAQIVGRGDKDVSGEVPFAPSATKVLQLALREALALGHNYIGTEHILLGLVRETDGAAARILLDFGTDPDEISGAVIGILEEDPGPDRPRSSRSRRWEYRVATVSPAAVEHVWLNSLGHDQWQLVTSFPNGDAVGLVFKRRVRRGETQDSAAAG
jgi:ATP-dependent Clp protease ATP-binding subunit ClpC